MLFHTKYFLKLVTTDLHNEVFNSTRFIDNKTEKCLLKITHIAEPQLEVKE